MSQAQPDMPFPFDETAASAESLARLLVYELGLDERELTEELGGLKLPLVISAGGFLPVMMRAAEEAAVAAIGKRLWNVAYHADPEAMFGLSVAEAESPGCSIPVATDIPLSLRHAFARHGMTASLSMVGERLSIEPDAGLSSVDLASLEPGEEAPLPTADEIIAVKLAGFIGHYSARIRAENRRRLRQEASLADQGVEQGAS